MKTRPKRFLNLATLSLALLGTTLLMAQPVKADNDTRESQERVDQRIEDPYDDGKNAGRKDGYESGNHKGISEEPPTKTPEPPTNPYSRDRVKSKKYRDGYQEWYVYRYYEGWHRANDEDKNKESSDHSRDQDLEGTEQTDTEYSAIISTLYGIAGVVLEYVLSWFSI
ncbi:hypothetical protein [Streptococcus pyogenes]|uniref:hypothetical protein n=1 Tax=Streptococcus pyogenes TaxID=1314 RepID=UPI0039BD7F74